jgi:putative beta-barrel porin BBP2
MKSAMIWTYAALTLLGIALTPAAALAQQTPPDQPPPPGTMVFGPVTLTPSLAIKDAGVDNNVFNDPVDPKSDFTFTIVPRAHVGFRARRLRVTYQTAADYVYYDTYETERGTNVSSDARADLDLGRLRPYVSVAGTSTRNRLNAEVDTRARHHDRTYGAGIAVGVASRTSLLLNARRATVEFEPESSFRGVSLEESFDSRTDSIEGGIGVELTPITTLSVLAQHEQQTFDLSPLRNSRSWRIAPTLTFSPIGLLTGTALLGYRHFDADDPTLPDYAGIVASVTIAATIYGRHELQGTYAHDVQYSYDPSTPYYIANGGTLTWTTMVAGPFDVRGTGGRRLMHYRASDPVAGGDIWSEYGGGIGFRFGDRARLGLNAEWTERDSDRSPDREYRNRRIFAALTWGTP